MLLQRVKLLFRRNLTYISSCAPLPPPPQALKQGIWPYAATAAAVSFLPKKRFPKPGKGEFQSLAGWLKKEDNGDWGRRLCFYMILINFNAATRSGCFGATAAALRAAIQMNLGYLKIKYVLSDG
jgi:hypothetical protein